MSEFENFLQELLQGKIPTDAQSAEVSDFISELSVGRSLPVILRRDGREVGRGQLSIDNGQVTFTELVPGRYTISLGTGWQLWEHSLSAKDLLLDESDTFDMAADTGESDEHVTVESTLPTGIGLRVIAGLNFGRLELSVS